MPDMNGIEAIRILKHNELTARIPVIMATGVMLTSEHLKTALEAGAIDFVRKPIDDIELLARINSALLFTELNRNYYKQKEELLRNEQQIIKQQNIILQNEKAHKDTEIATKSMQIVQMNEIITQLANELSEAINICPTKEACALFDIKSQIANKINTGFWKRFESHFGIVNKELFENLNHSFPQLSKNEKRLCLYIAMGLSTKEISIISLQPQNTIDVARYRLRTKLNLTQGQNLFEYLQTVLHTNS